MIPLTALQVEAPKKKTPINEFVEAWEAETESRKRFQVIWNQAVNKRGTLNAGLYPALEELRELGKEMIGAGRRAIKYMETW